MTKLNQIEQKFCEELTKAYGKTFDEVLKACDLHALSDDEKERLRIFFVFRAKYNNRKRENIFKDIKIYEWLKARIDGKNISIDKQSGLIFGLECEYCGVSQEKLRQIAIIRGKENEPNFTLNGKQKRKNGAMEIDRKDQKLEYEVIDNLVFACPLCNNAKSNLISSNDWKDIFADPMKKYYEKILGDKK